MISFIKKKLHTFVSVPYFPPNSGGISYWVAAPCFDQSEEIKNFFFSLCRSVKWRETSVNTLYFPLKYFFSPIKIINISYARVGIEPTTCHV